MSEENANTSTNQSLMANEQVAEAGQEQVAPAESPAWFYADGLGGEGDQPEWFKGDKYKSVADQAKAYSELEKKFGGFTGAPKDGYAMPEGFDPQDGRLDILQEYATKFNMSQDAFNEAASMILGNEQGQIDAEIASLGDNAQERIDTVSRYLSNQYSEEIAEQIKAHITSADAVIAVEMMMRNSKQPSLPVQSQVATAAVTQDEIERLMSEKDDSGRVIYHYSESRQKMVQEKIAQMHG